SVPVREPTRPTPSRSWCESTPTAESKIASVPEDLRFEAPDARALPPRVGREARFPTGLGEKPLAIPASLNRHLRQQQASKSSHVEDDRVTAVGEGRWIVKRSERAGQGELDVHAGTLRGG